MIHREITRRNRPPATFRLLVSKKTVLHWLPARLLFVVAIAGEGEVGVAHVEGEGVAFRPAGTVDDLLHEARDVLEGALTQVQVCRLQIPMNDARLVRLAQRAGDLQHDAGGVLRRHPPHLVQPGIERLAAEGITVERDLPDRPVLVDCFPGQLNQVFLPLLSR